MNLCISSANNKEEEPTHIIKKFIALFTFDLLHRSQLPFPVVVEGLWGRDLELGSVLSHSARRRETTFAHARMVPQPPLV